MGADIHIYAEYKAGDSPWTPHPSHVRDEFGYIESIGGDRNYGVFAALAGVRGYGPEPKGWPNDVSDIVLEAINRWKNDAHSRSYYSFKEFRKIVKNQGYPSYSEYMQKIIISHKKHLNNDLKVDRIILGQNINIKVEVRLLFFFDN
jgi:hypothetical protein